MLFRIHRHIGINLFLVLSLLLNAAVYAAKPVYVGGKERAAIKGYDPVAYFLENRPVKGTKEFSTLYQGAKWLFSSQTNLDLFQANPEKYAPQYGGYCAYAVSNGSTASIKPQLFTIYEDKLYLNYSKSVNKKWLKDKDSYIDDADREWPSIIDE